MNSYILKNNKEKQEVLLFQEKTSYVFEPKKSYKYVKKITVLDQEMLSSIWEKKIKDKYNALIKRIYELLKADDEEGASLIAYTEIERIKEYLLSLKNKGLKEKLLNEYMQKIYALEMKINNMYKYQRQESIGKGR